VLWADIGPAVAEVVAVDPPTKVPAGE
jgi:hypothetical protein